MNGHRAWGVIALLAALAAAVATRLLAVRGLDGQLAIGWPGVELGQYRLGAVASAAIAGALLGVAGAFLQGMLRNPLASPFVLGVSSGAGLGVSVASALAAAAGGAALSEGGSGGSVMPAVIGATGALAAVIVLGRRHGESDPTTIVLAGVIVGAICAAGSMIAESAVPLSRRGDLTTWLLGRIPEAPLDLPGPAVVAAACAALLVALALCVCLGPSLDAAAMSDDEARSVGVRIGALRAAVLGAAGIATAASVVLCGPIAFVGLIAPHVARGLVGPRHRVMCLAASVAGAALLVGADAARQFIDLGGGRLPVGALTALLGGAAFLWLLRRTAGGWNA